MKWFVNLLRSWLGGGNAAKRKRLADLSKPFVTLGGIDYHVLEMDPTDVCNAVVKWGAV